MALTLGKKKGGKAQKLNKKNAPQKRSINLAMVGVKKQNTPLAIVALVLILVGAAALSKFGVIDRLIAVDKARSEVGALQAEINLGYARIESYGELAEKYAHYTYSGMTQAELIRADRVEVLNLLDRLVLPRNNVASWTLHDNLLTMNITGQTLQELNEVCQTLEEDELVEYCTVTNATSSGNQTSNEQVTAQMVIHLKPAEEVSW